MVLTALPFRSPGDIVTGPGVTTLRRLVRAERNPTRGGRTLGQSPQRGAESPLSADRQTFLAGAGTGLYLCGQTNKGTPL